MRRIVVLFAVAVLGAIVIIQGSLDSGTLKHPGLNSAGASGGTTLSNNETFNGTPSVPPLQSSVIWSKTDANLSGGTNEILSLISENHNKDSYAWPLYCQLSATDNPAATLSSSQNTCVQARLFVPGNNTAWSTAYHAELYHGQNKDGVKSNAAGVSLDFNAETSRFSPAGFVAAYEANSSNGLPADAAFNVDGRFLQGLNFRGDSTGQTAIDVLGNWTTGIDLHGKSLKAGRIDASSLTVGGKPITQVVSPVAHIATVGRVTLAKGVYIDYSHGRVRIHRGGRIVGTF